MILRYRSSTKEKWKKFVGGRSEVELKISQLISKNIELRMVLKK